MAPLIAKASQKASRRLRPTAGVASAWDKEIRARVKAVDEGPAGGITYEQVVKEMAAKFGR